jgi:hypothetical protein
MIDFSAYIHSDWAWIVLFVMAIFVGMSKTGVQGLVILTVPLLAMTFGAGFAGSISSCLPVQGAPSSVSRREEHTMS